MDNTLNMISELLKKNKMSKIEFLTKLNLSKSAWSSWVRGETATYKDHIPEIAKIFNVSSDYLFGIEQKEKPAAERNELINKILTICDGLPEDKQTELLNYANYLVGKDK